MTPFAFSGPTPAKDISATRDVSFLKERIASLYDVVVRDTPVNGWSCKLLSVRDTNALLEQIDPTAFSHDERLPYWAEVWTSSVVLAERCIASGEFAGQTVLELGCGLGLAGIAAAKSGATVMMTDYESDALDFARFNSATNLTTDELSRVSIRHMDWRTPDLSSCVSRIIGADVVYERGNFKPLQDILMRYLPRDGYALFADPGRSIAADFFAGLSQGDFVVCSTGRHGPANPALDHIKFYVVRKRGDDCPLES